VTVTTPDYRQFRQRLAGGERLLGTFIKMPTTQPIEILGSVGYDFVVLDQEHSPLGPAEIDLLILASRASNIAPLVRVGELGFGAVWSALDCGASGIMFPRVSSVARAEEVAEVCRYASGRRGFAGMTRSAGWGAVRGTQHMEQQDAHIACVAMIEDREGVDRIEDIVGVKGLDAIFIGRGDLGASLWGEADIPAQVAALSERVATATRAAGLPLMMLVTDKADAVAARAMGMSAMMVASDHNFLRSAAAAAVKDYADI